MITRSQNFNGCGNKIFLDCESDAYQSVKRQNDYRITKLDYNEATGILSISQNPDVTKFTNIGDNSVTSNTFRSHLDAIEYILDYNKFKKSGTSKFDKCSNYLVYNQYAEADKKYIYFTYSQNANRWYEISLNEGDEFYDKLKNVKYRYHNGRLVNVVDVKLIKSQDRVGDRGTNITLSVEPSTSKGVIIPVVDEYNAGLMHPNDFRRFKDIDSELVGSFNIVDVDNNHWKLELVNKNGEVITSILIDKDNDNYLHDVEATITNGRRTLNFQMYDKTGPTTIYNVDLEDWFDYTGIETSSIKVEVNDNDEISANLKISSDKDNTLSLDNEGLVSILKWLDGDRINFKLGTEVDYDSKVFENVIYFATDTKNIIINGNKYGIDFNDNDIDLVNKIEFTDTIGEFKITNTNGEIYTLSLPLATSDYNGLMSAADKTKLDNLSSSLETSIEDAVNQAKEYANATFLPLSGGTMTGIIRIPYNGLQTSGNKSNSLIFYNDTELWYGSLPYRAVFDTSNTDMIHRKNGINHIIYDESNFVAGTDYLAPGNVTIADISDLGSTWDSYLKAGVYDRNITVNGTTYPVMTDVSGATAINIYAPTTAGTSGQFLKSTGGTPSWNSITVADISNLNSTWDAFMTGSNLDTRNILINGSAWTVYSSVGTDTTRIYAPTTMSTNSNQVLIGSSDSIPKWGYPNVVSVHDTRGTAPTPGKYTDYVAKFYFTDMELPDGISTWVSKLSVKGWSNDYNVWELAGYGGQGSADVLSFRSGSGDNWNNWHRIAFQDWTTTQLGNYLSLSGGTMTGNITMSANTRIKLNPTNASIATIDDLVLLAQQSNGATQLGNVNNSTILTSNNSDLTHVRGTVSSTIYDSGNTETRQLAFNGTNYPVIAPDGGTSTLTWYAPTTVGNQYQVLRSSGSGAPVWSNINDVINASWIDLASYKYDSTNGTRHVWNKIGQLIGGSSTRQVQIRLRASEDYNYPSYSEWIMSWTIYNLNGTTTPDSRNLYLAPTTYNSNHIDIGIDEDFNVWLKSDVEWGCNLQFRIEYNDNNANIGQIIFTSDIETIDPVTQTVPTFIYEARDICKARGTGDNALTDFMTNGYQYLPKTRIQGTLQVTEELGVSGDYIRIGDSTLIRIPNSNNGASGIASDSTNGTFFWFPANNQLVVGNSGATDVTLRTTGANDLYHQIGTGIKYKIFDAGNFGSIRFTGAATGTFNGTNDLTINIPTSGGTADSVAWANVTGKPNTFTPSAHNHSASNITSGTLALARIPTGTTSSTVALGNHTHETLVARYSGSGGVIAPSEVGTNVLRCRMMYANPESSGGGYCDWLLMNAYTWSDVPYCTGIGVLKASTPRAFIMSGPNSSDKADWNRLELATQNWVTSQGYLTSVPSTYATQSWVTSQINSLDAADIGAAAAMHTHVFSDITFNNTGTNSQYLAGDGKFYTIGWNEISGKPSTFSPSSHTHSASDITSGTLSISRLPTGTSSTTIALGNHTHGTDDVTALTGYSEGSSTSTLTSSMTLNAALASLQNQIQTKQPSGSYASSSHTHSAADITSGTLAIARIPTGTTSSTVALGNHTHSQYLTSSSLSGYATESYVDDAVANISIDTSNFVTITGTQTISGAKTFTHSNGVRSTYGFYDTSDIRLKSNIQDIELKDRINLYEFDKQGKHSYGVIAQEVEQLYPSVVNTDENGYKTVNYNEVLSIKCAELEAENKELKARLDKLEALVNSLL